MTRKKVVIVIVEGINDEMALEGSLRKVKRLDLKLLEAI